MLNICTFNVSLHTCSSTRKLERRCACGPEASFPGQGFFSRLIPNSKPAGCMEITHEILHSTGLTSTKTFTFTFTMTQAGPTLGGLDSVGNFLNLGKRKLFWADFFLGNFKLILGKKQKIDYFLAYFYHRLALVFKSVRLATNTPHLVL